MIRFTPQTIVSPRRACGRRVSAPPASPAAAPPSAPPRRAAPAALAVALAAGRTALLLALLFAPMTGCAQNTRGGSLDEPLADYDQGHYEAANRSATAVMARSSGQTRDEASYLSGLSAYRLGRLDEAEQRLMVASRSSDPKTAANASATLGLVRLDQNRPAEAAGLFKAAAASLDGDDASKAERYAAAATRMAGDTSPTSSWSPSAPSRSSSTSNLGYGYRTGAAAEPGVSALQVGAFRERARAEQAAHHAGTIVGRAGLGNPRILTRTVDRGQTLYVVQFGRFRSRGEASNARNRVGNLEYIVAPYTEESR